MSFVVAMVRTESARRALTGLEAPFPLRFVDSCVDLARLGTESGVLGIIVDIRDAQGRSPGAAIAAARRVHPGLPVLVWADREDLVREDLRPLMGAGVTSIQARHSGLVEQVAIQALVPRRTLSYHQQIDEVLQTRIPEPARHIVSFCLHPSNGMMSVSDVALALGIPSRTLSYRLRGLALPAATELLLWSRVLQAAWELENQGRKSLERIALDLGFSSAAGLRTSMTRLAFTSPSRLRSSGDFEWVLRCFTRALRPVQARPRHGRRSIPLQAVV
jgi:AraC-like DNA-binding protein